MRTWATVPVVYSCMLKYCRTTSKNVFKLRKCMLGTAEFGYGIFSEFLNSCFLSPDFFGIVRIIFVILCLAF